MTKRRIPFGLEGARLGPHDAGLGSIRPDQTVGLGAKPQGFPSWLSRLWFGRSLP